MNFVIYNEFIPLLIMVISMMLFYWSVYQLSICVCKSVTLTSSPIRICSRYTFHLTDAYFLGSGILRKID